MTEPRKLRVFLCHASQDKPIVRELYQRLLAEGWIDPWLDEEKLLPGQDWNMEIEKAVENADAVIVCLSSKSLSKEGFIQRELKFVLDIALEKPEGLIFVIPVRFDNCEVPRRLRSWQYVDYYPSAKREISEARLIESLRTRNKNAGITEDANTYFPIVNHPSEKNRNLETNITSFEKPEEYKNIPMFVKFLVNIGSSLLVIWSNNRTIFLLSLFCFLSLITAFLLAAFGPYSTLETWFVYGSSFCLCLTPLIITPIAFIVSLIKYQTVKNLKTKRDLIISIISLLIIFGVLGIVFILTTIMRPDFRLY